MAVVVKRFLAAVVGLVVAVTAAPALAYVVEVTTSIPAASAGDEKQLTQAIEWAVDDVLSRAIAFAPTVVVLRSARVVGDRIYLMLLVADGDGEETMKQLSAEPPATKLRTTDPSSAPTGPF